MENRLVDQGMISWFDIAAKDRLATVEFYKNVFGYEAEDTDSPEVGTYTLVKAAGHKAPLGGIFADTGEESSKSKVYFTVDNVDKAVEKALSLGGKTLMSPVDFEQGRMAVLADDAGCVFGVLKHTPEYAGSFDPSIEKDGGAHGVVSFYEVLSQDVQKAVNFYSQLLGFGVKEDKVGDKDYTLFTSESAKSGIRAGATAMPEQAVEKLGSRFIKKYIAVEDLEKTNSLVKENGGEILVPKVDIGGGKFSVLTDNTGTVFSVIDFGKTE